MLAMQVLNFIQASSVRASRHLKGRINNPVLQNVLIVFTLIGLAKVVGAAKEMAVAARYGTSNTVDAYLLLTRLQDVPISVWTSVLAATFVPLFFRAHWSSEALLRFRRELMGATLIAGAILGLASAFGMVALFSHISFGLVPTTQALAVSMAPPMALVIPFSLMGNIVFARLLASERHVISLLDCVPAFVLFIALLVIPAHSTAVLVWGTVLGAVARPAVLYLVQGRFEPVELPLFSFHSPVWAQFGRSCLLMGAADFVLNIAGVADQMMVAHLAPGAIATLGYANRLVALVLGLGATAIARTTLPILSRLHANGDDAAAREANRWVKIFFALGIVIAIAGGLFSHMIVQLVFQRGAFRPQDTKAVADVLQFGLLQVPFYFSSIIFSQLRAAHGRYSQFLYINIFNVAMKLLANWTLIPLLGIKGAMIGTALMYFSSMSISWWLVRPPKHA